MDNKKFVFGKVNFIILAISIAIIIFGFWMMSGGKTTEETGFDQRIFDTRRIIIAPIVTMIGFVSVAVAVLKKPDHVEDKTLKK